MFEKKFTVREIRRDGYKVTHMLRGDKKTVKRQIAYFKSIAREIRNESKKEMVIVL